MLTLVQALRRLPKVELHCHLEGTMRPATLIELARLRGIRLPAEEQLVYTYRSLDDFLTAFWLVQSVLVTPEDWARLAYESVLDAAAAGRVYGEVFFTPARHLVAGQSLRGVLRGLEEGLSAGDAETGSRTALICDMDRAYGGGAGLQLVTELAELRRDRATGADRVVGIGMDSTELGVDPRDFGPAYDLARYVRLRRTGHQGEDTPASAVATLVDELGAERVDHGLTVSQDPALVARLAERRLPLTMCPTSNVVIANRIPSVAAHPFPRMRAAGLLVTLNTDDPAMIDLDLTTEYALCAHAWGWDFGAMVDVALDGVEATWLDDADKQALSARVRTEGAALADQLAG